MTSTSSVNYKDSYFKYPVLIKICGEPTYETLHHLKNELNANASSVPTNSSGGNHGYLFMVLTTTEYLCILPNEPFTWPPNPGVLVRNLNGKATQITSAENNHCFKKKNLFRDSTSWENLYPTDHQGHRHQISCRPSQPCHRTNYTTRPDHPRVISQQLRTYHPLVTWWQNYQRQNNDFWPSATHKYHLQLHGKPGGISKSTRDRINS